jgi:23S rRNA pseudouridine2605 synthase
MTAPKPDSIRLNRFLSRCGLGSRRSVEELIRAGRVTVNGERVVELSLRVLPRGDEVRVDGRPVVWPTDFRVYAFHKPAGVVSTLKPQGGQIGLVGFRDGGDLPERFVPVGRLDAETTGLLLWTDDGVLNQALCRPASKVWKRYKLRLARELAPAECTLLVNGSIKLEGRACAPCRLELDQPMDGRHWLMDLREGRKRQIRRMVASFGVKVLDLHRVAVGPIELGRLKSGGFRRLELREVAALRRAAGLS